MLKLDVCAVEVVPRWQPGFEKQYGTACFRKYDTVDLDPDVPMRAQRGSPDVDLNNQVCP